MKAYRTVHYLVYSPNYVPGDGTYVHCESFKKAKKQCAKKGFGEGSEVDRVLTVFHHNGSGSLGNYIETFTYVGERKRARTKHQIEHSRFRL